MVFRETCVRHWLPIITFCPVNNLPDLIYVEIAFSESISKDNHPVHELYAIRKRIRRVASWKKKFMEDIAMDLFIAFPDCTSVKVTLAFGRHVVTLFND